MGVAVQPRWIGPRQQPSWGSFVASCAVTLTMFALALVAMRSVRTWSVTSRTDVAPPIVVRLPPPPVLVTPRRTEPRTAPRTAPRRTAPIAAPTPAPTPAISAPPAIAPAVPVPAATVQAPPAGVARGDSSAVGVVPAVPLGVLPRGTGLSTAPMPTGIGRGAPIAPVAVTGVHGANTARIRDSIITERMQDIPLLAKTHKPTGDMKAALEQSQRQTAMVQRRATTSGNSSDIHVPMGAGVGGVGADQGALVSVPAPILSSGPSPARRKKNAEIDADNQRRFRRLEDRLALKRDSIRADSLRRDALRRDSLARAAAVRKPE